MHKEKKGSATVSQRTVVQEKGNTIFIIFIKALTLKPLEIKPTS